MTENEFMERIETIQHQLKHTYDKDVQINVDQDIDLVIDDTIVAYFDGDLNNKLYLTSVACNFVASEILPVINDFNNKVSQLINQYDNEL